MSKKHSIYKQNANTIGITNNTIQNPVFDELYYHSNNLEQELEKNNINYSTLKHLLIPTNKGDIAFIFNWQKIEDADYGEYILKQLIPFLLNDNFCYLHGDYGSGFDSYEIKRKKECALLESLYEKAVFINPSICYIIYITNIGRKKAIEINNYLKRHEISYLGFADLSTNNLFKSYLSKIIVSKFIKLGQNIIQPGSEILECTINNKSNSILNNYFNTCIDIPDYYYYTFLLYKIPSILKRQ